MKIEILLGSVRTGRESHKAASYLREQFIRRGHTAEIIDLREMRLPIFGEHTQEDVISHHKTIAETGTRLAKANAIVLVTPEYNGTFSGVLKNALEFYEGEFKRKPIGVVTSSTGRLGGINASTQLQHVILSLGAYPIPQKLLIHDVNNAFDENGDMIIPRLRKEKDTFLDEFLWFCNTLNGISTTELFFDKTSGS